jgi:hypothetical protein
VPAERPVVASDVFVPQGPLSAAEICAAAKASGSTIVAYTVLQRMTADRGREMQQQTFVYAAGHHTVTPATLTGGLAGSST